MPTATRFRSSLAAGVRQALSRRRDLGQAGAGKDTGLPDVAEDSSAQFLLESWNAETREIEVVLSTGGDVVRTDYSQWPSVDFIERLSLDPAHVDLSRLNEGAPWLRVHNAYSLDDVLGVIVPGSIRIEGKDLRATGGENTARLLARVRLSDAKGDEDVVRKLITGIIRGVSIGYDVLGETITRAEGQLELRTATNYLIFEGSSVPIGADSKSGTRARSGTNQQPQGDTEDEMKIKMQRKKGETEAKFLARQKAVRDAVSGVEIEIVPGESDEVADTEPAPTDPLPSDDIDKRAAAAVQRERQRGLTIRQAARTLKIADTVAEELVDAGVSEDAARKRLFDLAAERDKANAGQGVQVGDTAMEKMARGAELYLLHRSNPAKFKIDKDEEALRFRGMSMFDIGREFVEANGLSIRGMDRLSAAGVMLGRGMMRASGADGTSDFPNIMANVQRKTLRNSYEEAQPTYKLWSRGTTVQDFRNKYAAQLGAAPELEKIGEHGEFKRGSIVDGAEAYGIETYGKIVTITRRALINDDLGALTRIPSKMAAAAARLENRIVYGILLNNGLMADGKAIFHADHSNIIATGGGVPNAAQLKAVRSKLTMQTDLDGVTRLNLPLRMILVPDALYVDAHKELKENFLATSGAGTMASFFRDLMIVTDPIIDDTSAVQWYGFADPSVIDGIEYAYLEGNEGPVLDSEVEFGTDGLSMKVRHDFGAGCLDHRFAVRNAGA